MMRDKLAFPPLSPAKDPAGYPLFQGEISRWIWRMYSQRLTSAGRWFALVTALFGAYGGASLQIQGYVLAAYAQAIWFVAFLALLLYRPRVSLRAQLAPRVSVGQTLPVDVEIEQQGRLRGADLFVLQHQLPAAIDAVPDEGVALPDM